MKKLWLPLAAALAFALIAALGWVWKQAPAASRIECRDPTRGCTFIHRGLPAEVRFDRLPRPFEPFHMNVNAPGALRVSTEFQMDGMDMGFNRHDLKPEARGRYAGEVALPACVSGSHAWVATLDLDGNRYTFGFYNRE